MKLFKEIEDNFDVMLKLFDRSQLQEFANCSYNNLFLYHFGLGKWIRNNLLYEGSKSER